MIILFSWFNQVSSSSSVSLEKSKLVFFAEWIKMLKDSIVSAKERIMAVTFLSHWLELKKQGLRSAS